MMAESEHTTHREFAVGQNPRLSVNITAGEVTILAGVNSVICVDAAGGHRRAYLECTQDGDHVEVCAHGSSRGAAFDISVPRGCSVRLHTTNGDVAIVGTQAPVDAETTSGDLQVEDATGECRLHTVGGDIVARHLAGSLMVHTINGEVRIHESRLSRFNVHSTNGDCEIETSLDAGEHYLVRTVNGDVWIAVPPGTGLLAQLRTQNGEISSDLPSESIHQSRRNWQTRINGGGAILEMESVNGGLHISGGAAREASTAAEEATDAVTERNPFHEPDRPATDLKLVVQPESRGSEPGSIALKQRQASSILTELEEGRLTVEEALRQLNALKVG